MAAGGEPRHGRQVAASSIHNNSKNTSMPQLWPLDPKVTIRVKGGALHGMCVGHELGGVSRVMITPCGEHQQQLWKIYDLNLASKDGKFQLKSSMAGKCLDVSGEDHKSIGLWECGNKQPNQIFQWRGMNLLAQNGACLCGNAETQSLRASNIHNCCNSFSIMSAKESVPDARFQKDYQYHFPEIKAQLRHNFNFSDSFTETAIQELSDLYRKPPENLWGLIQHSLKRADSYSRDYLKNGLHDVKSDAQQLKDRLQSAKRWSAKEWKSVGLISSKVFIAQLPVVGFSLIILLFAVRFVRRCACGAPQCRCRRMCRQMKKRGGGHVL